MQAPPWRHAGAALAAWRGRFPGLDAPGNRGCQRSWDELGASSVLSGLIERATGVDEARLRAVSRPESGAWLNALPSPHFGNLLDDEPLRIAVALRLGTKVCESHVCRCGAPVEANGHHGLSCLRSSGRFSRHAAINDLLHRALKSADIPNQLEPTGLSRSDGKRPDGATLVPWQRGKCLLWDATCVCTFAKSHVQTTTRQAGAAAERAAKLKHDKYSNLSSHEFVPFAVETAGSWGREAKDFVRALGRRLRERGHDHRSGSWLAQRISIAIQRGNAASVMGTFGPETIRDGLF